MRERLDVIEVAGSLFIQLTKYKL